MNSINILPARTLSVIRAKFKSKHRKDLNTFPDAKFQNHILSCKTNIISRTDFTHPIFFQIITFKPHMINITNFIVQILYQCSRSGVFRDINFFVSYFEKLQTFKWISTYIWVKMITNERRPVSVDNLSCW